LPMPPRRTSPWGVSANNHTWPATRAPSDTPPTPAPVPILLERPAATAWSPEAEKELKKIPFFVRGKARTNTETFARERLLPLITLETLYDAKAHYGR